MQYEGSDCRSSQAFLVPTHQPACWPLAGSVRSLGGVKTTVYLELLEEGTPCWRPVNSESLGGDLYRIISEKPEDEVWPFNTGDTVRCRPQHFQQGLGLVAYERVTAG
jgi:hypothetical protein